MTSSLPFEMPLGQSLRIEPMLPSSGHRVEHDPAADLPADAHSSHFRTGNGDLARATVPPLRKQPRISYSRTIV